MDKEYFYSKYIEQVSSLKGNKPRLLLHVCCGPCSTFPLKELSKFFDITIFYSNSNIYPENEYKKRISELKKVINHFKDKGILLNYVEDEYDPNSFLEIQKKFANTPEGGERCVQCIKYRLNRTFAYAKKNNFDYFCSVMTVSQNKNATMINKIGEEISKEKNEPFFLYSDFKKRNGLEEGIKIAKGLNLYRQNYCGCELSFHEMESRVLSKKQ